MAAKSFVRRARRAAAAQELPFWKRKSLARMTKQEWESLCDGCGMCCVNKLEYEGTGELAQTDTCCKLLDPKTALPGLQEPQEDRAGLHPAHPKGGGKDGLAAQDLRLPAGPLHGRTSIGGTPWSRATRKPCTRRECRRGKVIPEDQVEDMSERVVDWFA